MNIEEAKKKLFKALPDLKAVSKEEEFEHNYDDTDERFEALEMAQIAERLHKIVVVLDYMNKPVQAEGRLVKRSDGRYEIEDHFTYFTSGSPIEVWSEGAESFVRTRVEHTQGDYYAVGFEGPLEGRLARTR